MKVVLRALVRFAAQRQLLARGLLLLTPRSKWPSRVGLIDAPLASGEGHFVVLLHVGDDLLASGEGISSHGDAPLIADHGLGLCVSDAPVWVCV